MRAMKAPGVSSSSPDPNSLDSSRSCFWRCSIRATKAEIRSLRLAFALRHFGALLAERRACAMGQFTDRLLAAGGCGGFTNVAARGRALS
jgi:hypothetical protein